MEILKVQNISKSFDWVRAVDALSFGIEKGTVTALTEIQNNEAVLDAYMGKRRNRAT